MKTIHTKGPWQALNGGPFITSCLDKEGEYVIAVTSNTASQVQFAAKVASLEDRANARLIASAPELLEALKRINRTSVKETFGNDIARFQLWLDGFTRAAISKAEGNP